MLVWVVGYRRFVHIDKSPHSQFNEAQPTTCLLDAKSRKSIRACDVLERSLPKDMCDQNYSARSGASREKKDRPL